MLNHGSSAPVYGQLKFKDKKDKKDEKDKKFR